jgi:NAD(P)-dependent dehydrogenase (short-subunit alcohol dehydrogenase family)
VVAELNPSTGEETARVIRESGGSAECQSTDITREDSVRGTVEMILTRNQIDILVNNAGLGQTVKPLIDLSLDEFQGVLAVNLIGTFLCSKWVGWAMAQRESGAIVNIASLNGIAPAALVASYNAAKAAVVSLTQTLALELAPYRVRVNAVGPGPVYTEFNRQVMRQRAEVLGITESQKVERLRAAIPLGRWGEPEDVARAVVYLCSEQSAWVTGQLLPVTGGLSGIAAAPAKRPVSWPA